METLFELTFQDQTLNPQVGTFTDASQATGTFTLEDGEYYLTNADTKGFYAYKPIALQSGGVDDSKVIIEFDLKVVTASANTHTIIGTYAGVDGSGIPTGAKITLQYNAGDIELVLGSGATATLIESADVVVDQWYHFRIDCALDALTESTYKVKIDGVLITTVTGATTDYELGIISVLGTDLHACDECGIKNITLVTETNLYVGRTALDQALQDVKGYVDSHNGVLTIQKNGANIGTFSANQETDETINIEVPDALPIGSYIQFAGSQAPDGFLVCNGGEISRTTYSQLFDVIGTTYGSGDGSTTFNLPNLTDRFLQGSTTSGTVKDAGLPNITGRFGPFRFASSSPTAVGAFNLDAGADRSLAGADPGSAPKDTFTFSASRSSSIYGSSTTVQPPALTCLICIKY
jgi:microcystin-dependent protein